MDDHKDETAIDLGAASTETRGQPVGLYAEIFQKTDRPMLTDD